MTEIEWSARTFGYCSERNTFKFEDVSEHPLKTPVLDGRSGIKRAGPRATSSSSTRTPTPTQSSAPLSVSQNNISNNPLSSNSSFDGSDPLTHFFREEMDPLSKMAADEWDYSTNKVAAGKKSVEKFDDSVESWSSRRVAILNKYTTLEKLSIITSFLPGGEKIIVKVQPTTSVVDKVQKRLEQLDDFEDGSIRQMLNLTQQEYVSRIEQLNSELVQAWHSDQRVKALKIAIQCSKLLVDTSVISFYPSKYVLITDILDIFGKLVYERLKVKAESIDIRFGSKRLAGLPENFTPDMVPDVAKETCQNWFYKIASIKELVPRLYLEMALIKSYNFLNTREINASIKRITKMIRGIGDPLVSVYARCYLCRVGSAFCKSPGLEFVKENFCDFLLVYQQLFFNSVKNDLIKQNITIDCYLNLYAPALDWILHVLTETGSDTLLTEVFSYCKKQPKNGLLLNTILKSFKPSYVSFRAVEFVDLISACEDSEGFPQYILYKSLGECLCQEAPQKDDCQYILNSIWNYMSSVKDTAKFMDLMEVWIQFTIIHFSATEVNLFLGAIINRLDPNRTFQYFYTQLQTIVQKIVVNTHDFQNLLTMDNFSPMVDLFQKESIKVEVCKTVVEGLSKQNSPIVDTIMINALMYILRALHDSVSALTVEDEKRQISQLISNLILRVDYGKDFEKQLDFYVEARDAFHNLDMVHIQLVQCVNRLSINTRKIVRGHHTKRTSAFVRACAAYCFITIPSLSSVYSKLQLYLLSGQVDLLNQCYGQADACFKAALTLVPEMPKTIEVDGKKKSSETFILSYLSNFLSTLLVVPDNPDHGVLYLLRGLLNAAQRFFEEKSMIKVQLYFRVLDLLSLATQDIYPYHIDKVDSNDKLYGSDPKFIIEVNKICSKVFSEILSHLKYLGSTEQYDKQSQLSLSLFLCMVIRADLEKPNLSQMAVNLWNLSQKNGLCDSKQRTRVLEYITRKSQTDNLEHFEDILKKLTK